MQLVDEIADITFRNEENGYSVIRLKTSNITATGVFAFVSVGAELTLHGEFVNNAKYGKQFKVTSYEITPPNTPKKIKQFIGSGLIEGIGPVTAERIVKTFGKDTLKIMENAPEELIAVRGISEKKAKVIGEKYATIKQMQAAIIFLQKFEISLNMAVKIYKSYGEKTIEAVQSNPYSLIERVDGIGFITADKMARDLGIDYTSSFRVRAGLVYCLKQASEKDGHTFLPHKALFQDVIKLLKIKTEQLEPVFEEVLRDLCLDKFLTMVKSDKEQGYMLTKYYVAERSIATRLNSHAIDFEEEQIKGVDKLLNHYQKINNIELHDKQKEAVRLATSGGVCVITGGPGTGKTTIVKAILYINEAQGLNTRLLAPTGRAAKRMEEATGMPASTIHRALELDYSNNSRNVQFEDWDGALSADVVIVDEFSMCDVQLTSQLLKRILPRTRIILVGDADQLPSVGAGSVLNDILQSSVISTVCLTEIYRQEGTSQIVHAAHAINKGMMPDLSNKSSDFFFVNSQSASQVKQNVVSLATTRIPNHMNVSPSKIQILCPMKVGEAGMNSLNLALQESLNPPVMEKPQYEYGDIIYRTGDRVMQTMNNYDQEWTRNEHGMMDNGTGVYNGDIGEIIQINRQNGEVVVQLEDGRVTTYTRSDLSNLVLSYAITVHKSQGCEFDVVIIPIVSGAYMILTRNLLYTAVTRAKKMVVLVGDSINIEKMVNNTFTKKRYTMLKEFLREMKDKTSALYE
ncbi:MAG: ATP-dependent RecD-like DNA helicase [Firmicutes bacterium]|nr:ATP-dependent RecD-like DNA helicase [Bacillota bacterium]